MNSILIIDDHAMFRCGLRKVLQDMPELGEVHETGEWRTGLEMIERAAAGIRGAAFDVLLLDINLPDRSGLDLLSMITARFAALRIIMLSMYSEPQYALRAMRNGAKGYVAKDMEVEVLVAAIRSVRRGRTFVTQSVAQTLLGNMHAAAAQASPHERLSVREAEILRLIVGGGSLTGIAGHLAINVKTVSTYRRRIFEKLGVGSNAQLVQYAVHNRLVD